MDASGGVEEIAAVGAAGDIYGFTDLNQSRNLRCMSTVEEIEAAIPKLSRAEIEELRVWIDDFLEDQLELKDEVIQKMDQSRAEIKAGNYKTRQP